MSALAFAAWGSIDFENLGRVPRRAYLKRVRKEIAPHGLVIHAGGRAPLSPHYQVLNTEQKLIYSGTSFREACTEALNIVDPNSRPENEHG